MTNGVPGRPDQGRRLTKAERKDQARREREELQRRLASKRRARALGISVGAVVVAAIVFAATLLPSGGGDQPSPDQLLQRAAGAAGAAGCGDVTTTPPFDPPDQDQAHLSDGEAGPPLSAYPTTPPASGPMTEATVPAGVYESFALSQVYASIHSIEHGAAVIWYDPIAPAEKIARVIEFYDRRLQDAEVGQDRVIVAPYDFPGDPAGVLPDGSQMALAAWQKVRTCASVDLAVAFDFTSQYASPTAAGRDYQGEAPEPGGPI